MLDLEGLILIETELDDFIREKINWNLQNCNSNNMKSFFNFTKSLIKFGELFLNNKTRDIRIYKQQEYTFVSTIVLERYYAIDNSGLSHSFIFGPNQSSINSRDIFYGFHSRFNSWGISLDKSFSYYECVKNFNPNKPNFPNLEFLKNEYLPLKKPNYGGGYFTAGNDSDISRHGPLIYRDENNCFHLPIVQLLKETLNLNKFFKSIKTELTPEYILFRSCEEWMMPGRNHWRISEGKISYETFEVRDFCILEEDSENNK